MIRSNLARVGLILVLALAVGYYDLPAKFQTLPGTPKSVKDAKVHLGLDLQGGSQLDYKVDLRKVPEKDQKTIVEGVLNIINKRVNLLGVSEPNIYTSTVGNEKHIVVELAGIKDLEEAKKAVGKTIQLEFKERRAQADPAHKENVKKSAQAVLDRVLSNKETFEVAGQQEAQANVGKVNFEDMPWSSPTELPQKIREALKKAKDGEVIAQSIEDTKGYIFENGELSSQDGFFLVKSVGKRDANTLPVGEKSVEVSHLIVSYKDAQNAPETVTRSKEEAQKRAEDLLKQIQGGANFEKIAQESSDEPGAKTSGGKLGAVKVGGSYDTDFTNAVLELTKPNELSGVVESPFGFYIIRADNFTQYKYSQIFFSTASDMWKETGLTGEQFQRAEVVFGPNLMPTVSIQFNEKGAKLFEEITARNVNKPLAIFVGGQLITNRPPNVREKITGGNAEITGSFSVEEAQALARDLNTGAIPAPVALSGQYTIGATLGQEALDQSLKAGIIGIALLSIFMILYYRLPGLVALLGLSLYTLILFFLIKSELPLALSLLVALVVFIAIIYTLLKSQEGGWEKFITFVLACFVLFFVSFLLTNPITLTLAGVAGVILSIGMAVDANILIFERTKEELRAGRPLSSAIDIGFHRAWSSIRDSNFSSLITCAILFYFGSSIIQGFAFNLAAGILVSMFTAITITRTLLHVFMKTRLGSNLWLWGVTPSAHEQAEKKPYHIVQKHKIWFGISGVIIAFSLLSLMTFGLKLGIDFKGGTLLDLTFKPAQGQTIMPEDVKKELATIGNKLKKAPAPVTSGETALESASSSMNFENARVVSAGINQFIINLEHVDNETHDKVLQELGKKFGGVTENRFTTIGPVVGETLKKKAVFALLIAMIAIVLYIALAFRKVPKPVSPWKFGICAIVALLHDVIIPMGVFSVLKLDVDALFITAVLTVLGFSVHDTIVVFDRIRENLKQRGRDESLTEVANKSMTQTMARSINTSLTTLITLTSLLIFGSPSIFNLVLILVIGIVVGTYSSIFIASPLLVLWQKKDEK